MLDYVKFEAGGFGFEHPSAWRVEQQPGFECVVCGPGMLRVYFSVRTFADRSLVPSYAMAHLHLLAAVHSELPEGVSAERTQLGEIIGIALHDSFVREGDQFETYLIALRCLQGTGVARAVLGVTTPATLLDAAGPVIHQILESFTIDRMPWSNMKKLPTAETTELDLSNEPSMAPTAFFALSQEVQAMLSSTESGEAPQANPSPSAFMPTSMLADSMLSSFDSLLEAESEAPSAPPPASRAGQAATVNPAAYAVSTITGGGGGFRDGPAAMASFQRPNGITADPQGNLYVADFGNHRIRRITPEGITNTLAGSLVGYRDEPGTLAMFNGPRGIVYVNGYIYVTDLNNALIRRLTLDGVVRTFSGSGSRGFNDGMVQQAQFDTPRALAADSAGNLFVADGARVRRITGDGRVQTIAGSTAGFKDGSAQVALFDTLGSITLDTVGNIYVADVGNHTIRKISRSGEVTTLPQGPAAGKTIPILEPVAVVAAPDGTLYIADAEDFSIKCLFPDGSVALIAGNGEQGHRDGKGGRGAGCAEFWSPTGLALAKNVLYVTERDTHVVRAIRLPRPVEAGASSATVSEVQIPRIPQEAVPGTAVLGSGQTGPAPAPSRPPSRISGGYAAIAELPSGPRVPISRDPNEYTVSTLAGSDSGFRDGSGEAVRFNSPMGLCVDTYGTIYVADHFNHCIRGVTNDGMVLTLAGSLESGLKDDVGTRACFKGPLGIAVGPEGNLYVSDHLNGCIRIVTLKGEVITLAGNGVQGFRDGQGQYAQFEGPKGIAVSPTGRVYVADAATIRCIDQDGTVITLAGGERGHRDGRGSEAAFGWPYALAMDVEGNCYVADAANHAVRRVAPDGTVTTIFGGPGQKLLNFPSGVAVDLTGVVYVADTNSHRILRLDPNPDRTGVTASLVCGSRQGTRNGRGPDAELNGPRGLGIGPGGEIYIADSGAHRIVKVTARTATAKNAAGPTVATGPEVKPPAPTLESPLDVPVPIRGQSAPLVAGNIPVSSSGNNFPTWKSDPLPSDSLLISLEEAPSWSSDAVPRSIKEFAKHLENQEVSPPPDQPGGNLSQSAPVVVGTTTGLDQGQVSMHDKPTLYDAAQAAPTPPAQVMVQVPAPAPAPPPVRRQRLATQMFGWGLELVGQNTVRTEADGALYLNTCQDPASSAFFFNPWDVTADQEVVVEARLQLISYVGDRAHTGCAIWVENDRFADALLIQPEGISLLRAPDLIYACDTVTDAHTYTIVTHENNIMVLVDGTLCLNGAGRFWLRPRAKSGEGGSARRWVAFGDGSSTAGSESRWHFVRYRTQEPKTGS